MAASLWLLQLPSPPPLSTSRSSSPSSASPLLLRKHAPTRARGSLVCGSSGSSSSSSVVTKDQEGAAEAPVSYDYRDDPNFRGCKGCGREEPERGCNGEGRIMGGIAAVPLFGWWPIKAYRPCPGFVASGGRYRRYGQSMDDVIAGKGRKVPSNKKKSGK